MFEDLLIVIAVVAAGAATGWRLGQRLRAKTIIVGLSLAIAALATGFVIAYSLSRPHDSNIGAGLLLFVLAVAVVAAPVAVLSARRHRR